MLSRGVSRMTWLVGLASLALASAVAEADTFQYQDEAGTLHYTNVPADPRYRRVPGLPEDRSSVPVTGRPVLPGPGVGPYAELIRTTAERHRVDRRLVEALVTVESGGNPRAVSRKGAQGLMQLMPQRSAELGVRNAFDPEQNVDGGVRHLRDLLERFGGDVALALAAYNAGEEAVRSYRGVPPYAETQEYVRRIRALYDGVEGPGRASAASQAPQQIYRQVAADGTITFTNLPPRPVPTLKATATRR
jgi:soluble lytic murein transglycosylase-like protein